MSPPKTTTTPAAAAQKCPCCERPMTMAFRGVCRTCLMAWHKDPKSPAGAKAASFITAKKVGGGKVPIPMAGLPEGAAVGVGVQAEAIDRTQARHAREADARVAMATELAAALGIARQPHLDGFLIGPSAAGRRVFITAAGHLRPAEVRLGEVLAGPD